MEITDVCKECAGKVAFDAEHVGTTISCPHCGKDMVLAVPKTVTPPPVTKPVPLPSMLSPCPHCGHDLSKQAEMCPHCGFRRASDKKPDVSVFGIVAAIVLAGLILFVLLKSIVAVEHF